MCLTSTHKSSIRIEIDYRSLRDMQPHVLLKMMLRMNILKDGRAIDVLLKENKENTEMLQRKKELELLSTLEKNGQSIDPPTAHTYNNYNTNDQGIDFEEGWDEEKEEQ